jgi:MoxR-like ATPase
VRALSNRLQANTFEYLLTRFTEPNELFGPFDIRKLREGDLVTNTEGMLPEASLIFLDELLNANSAILNSLLMVLNERIFRRGKENRKLPVLMTVGASNHLPEDDALEALFDRFLIRVHCDNVAPDKTEDVLKAGWILEKINQKDAPVIDVEAVRELQQKVMETDLSLVREPYLDAVHTLRNAGIPISDRRAVKLQRLIAASALLCKREQAVASDLWILRYIWDNEQQQEVIAAIVDRFIDADDTEVAKHPGALKNPLPNADELYEEVMELRKQWDDPKTDQSMQALIKDKLRHLQSRSEWIQNETQRKYIQEPVEALWNVILANDS